jgi:predicted transcriptional regulator
MSEWRKQLDSCAIALARNASAEAFIAAFGALEVCLLSVAQKFDRSGTVAGEDRFSRVLRILCDKQLLTYQERLLASHIANARNCVAHSFGFEPSTSEVHKTVKAIERLCGKFGTKVYDVMVKPVITSRATDQLGPFIPKMVEDGISHIPVINDSEVIGTLTDVDVLKAWEKGEGILDPCTAVEKLMTDQVLPNVRGDLSIEEARRILISKNSDAVIVLYSGLPQGILTRFDLLEHVDV